MNGGQKRAFARDGFLVVRNGSYKYDVLAGDPVRTIAKIEVNCCSLRHQDYKVTMEHNGDVIFPFDSVRKAAERAVRYMPHIPDFQI